MGGEPPRDDLVVRRILRRFLFILTTMPFQPCPICGGPSYPVINDGGSVLGCLTDRRHGTWKNRDFSTLSKHIR